MANEVSDETMQEILAAIKDGKKIEAIKIHCEATDGGLKESKDAIDALEAELREKYPEQFPKAGKSGCLVVLGLLAGAAGWAGAAFWA